MNPADFLACALVTALLAAAYAPASPPVCSNATITLSHDYGYAIGSADFDDPDGDPESGSAFRWLVNGTPLASGQVAEGLLLPFDGSPIGANGETPNLAQGVTYTAGKWGQALSLAPQGRLRYPREDNLHLDEGTIEMWVASRADGDDPIYSSRWHVLFFYQAPNGDSLYIALDEETGILYAGGVVNDEWQSAYGSLANTRGWRAGEWHHLALTYSAAENTMRFYVDGILTADTNEERYWPPSEGGEGFYIGGDPWGNAAHYVIDQVRLSGRAADGVEIATRAQRPEPARANEVWLPTSQVNPGDALVFEFIPATRSETGSTCSSDPLVYPGIPITDPDPPSTLLPPGTTRLDLSVHTITATTCGYNVGAPLPYDDMTPFDQGAGSTSHRTVIGGLDPDPNVVNEVYVRCAAHPDYFLHLRYRSLSQTNPSYPRTGNLWGWWEFQDREPSYIARIDLWLGARFTPGEIRKLRRSNPDIRILTSINAVENKGLPDDYYLKDIHGQRIEVWPGSYRLNLTKRYVAEHQARYAYQTVLDSGMMADGVFFDNVMTSQSWLTSDIYGNPVQIDADEDGFPDDPEALDAAWKAGVFHEIETFRRLMPHAIVSGHAMDIYEPGIAELFNGISIGFWTADVIEGRASFPDLWAMYNAWHERARQPTVVMIESSPPDQIAYGYGYAPWDDTPPATLEFARTYYPYVRFGLALTLMNDGYFAHEFGDTWHGNDWWYDELDFDLGFPLGPAERVDLGEGPGENLIENGDFEDPIAYPWDSWANEAEGCAATVSRDTTEAVVGTASARIDVTATSGTDWHIEFAQYDRTLEKDVVYDLSFWAKSDAPRPITLSAQKGSPDWRNYGLWRHVTLDTEWREYTVSFQANETVSDSRIQFMVGQVTGTVWLDDVRLTKHPPDVYRREFTHGLVLLNATREPRTITVGPGYQRLVGSQAPLYEAILDDEGAHFSTTGDWIQTSYDSGEWQASGPYYHDWGAGCHEHEGTAGEARWELPIVATDTYTITAWWPAAPESNSWNPNAVYEVVADGQVVASTTLDQRSGGDQWHLVAVVPLAPEDGAYVRLRCQGEAPCIADALHLRSQARYNDGSPAEQITLSPMDGIVLQRAGYHRIYLPILK